MLRYERADRPRYEPHFSRDDVPDAIVAELLDLLHGTIG
jgi:hypothetical protein